VDWYVLANPMTITQLQVDLFTANLPEQHNERPVQALGSEQEISRGVL
jgi:carbonic anhydrase